MIRTLSNTGQGELDATILSFIHPASHTSSVRTETENGAQSQAPSSRDFYTIVLSVESRILLASHALALGGSEGRAAYDLADLVKSKPHDFRSYVVLAWCTFQKLIKMASPLISMPLHSIL